MINELSDREPAPVATTRWRCPAFKDALVRLIGEPIGRSREGRVLLRMTEGR